MDIIDNIEDFSNISNAIILIISNTARRNSLPLSTVVIESYRIYMRQSAQNHIFLVFVCEYNETNYVSCKTKTFYDFFGDACLGGGAERYIIDLNKMLHQRSIQFVVFQLGKQRICPNI